MRSQGICVPDVTRGANSFTHPNALKGMMSGSYHSKSTMKFLADPKNCMWTCRILPFCCITIFGIILLIPLRGVDERTVSIIMLIVVVIFGSFIMYYLPGLLFEGNYRLIGTRFGGCLGTNPWWYLFFATLTLGLGPICWYWWKIDPVLKEMIKAS